jgi:hypothetical protein
LNLPITYLEDAPRVLDTDLGRALGMAKPENIRQTINANRQELEELGVITHTVITPGAKGGPLGRAFYLNEEQATYVTMHAKTPKAREVKLLVVRVFTAWRRGVIALGAITPRRVERTQREGTAGLLPSMA